jgi:spermidine/putrescine-binding protein
MPRLRSTIGALAATILLSLSFGTTAHAATRTLVINFAQEYSDPSEGCYEDVDGNDISMLDNRTDQRAYVFSDSGCRGYQTTIVHPGEGKTGSLGASVYIR